MERAPRLSIIIVAWNCWDYLTHCITSINDTLIHHDYEIIIVDSNSRDEAPAQLLSLNKRITLIRLDTNVGFAKGNNIAFEKASGDILLALNPDTVVHQNTIDSCVEYLDSHPETAVVGVKTFKANGRIELSCAQRFPTIWRMVCNTLMLDKVFRWSEWFGGTAMPYWDHLESCDVDMVSGAFMMIRREIYEKLGGFNEVIPMYVDDMEYCMRLKRHGMKVHYLAERSMTHYTGGSIRRTEPKWVASMRCEAAYYLLAEAEGKQAARKYVFLLLLIYPMKLVLLPGLIAGKYLLNKQKCFLYEMSALWASWLWAIKKIVNFDRIHCPQSKLPD